MDEIDQMVKPLILSDLRTQLRARGENPGGSEQVGENQGDLKTDLWLLRSSFLFCIL